MSFTLRRIDLHKPTAQWYSDYLQGTKWRKFRERLILQRGPLCEVCNERDHFSLHHKTYARLFNELEEDVILVCKECHKDIHERYEIPFIEFIYNDYPPYPKVFSLLRASRKQPKLRS